MSNPILVAREIEAELKATPGATHETVARRRGVHRTRICQYLALLALPMDVQEYLVAPENVDVVSEVSECKLRELVRCESEAKLRQVFRQLVAEGQRDSQSLTPGR